MFGDCVMVLLEWLLMLLVTLNVVLASPMSVLRDIDLTGSGKYRTIFHEWYSDRASLVNYLALAISP